MIEYICVILREKKFVSERERDRRACFEIDLPYTFNRVGPW